ncbi:DNA methyltransferase [Cypionkella aquatica]|uniref:DNA methyltransferase n=1 Tax=Cypionkella aquatica TaxID=1756042 RepID=A0AA37WYC3_9RHOB|nr:16S rRNA (guanine(966)-N(2))-methyltransferase RsmD [Cypionkella aquatica]GLS85248.1 DNA methyltransferase [Cypionkella aquatica]
MRIIGGTARGLHLAAVGEGDAKAHLRPTSDRVRESIFNLLINGGYGNPLRDARVLDVFAGTGALGLEALSRGAAEAVFLENGAAALALLKRNIALMRAVDRCEILRRDATKPGINPGAAFDVVFLDPPYGKAMGEQALTALIPWLAPEALVIWEESLPPIPPSGFVPLDQRKYGDTLVTILKAPS